MSPIRFSPHPSPSEPEDLVHDLSNSQRPLSPAQQETGGYPIPKATHNVSSLPYGVDLHTLTYSLNRSMQRPQDFTGGWSVRGDPTFSPYTYGGSDINYEYQMNSSQGAEDDPYVPRTTYPCDPRVIFNQNLDETPFEYPRDLQRQDQYALFGYGDPPDQHQFSRLSISNSPAGQQDHTASRSSSRYPSPSAHGLYNGTPNGGDDDGDGLEQTDGAELSSDEPYAKLIYRALKDAPNHAMVLKDIYQWFERNTDKAKSTSKGWQNSIRHNLSMNGAFKKHEREPSSEDGKKYCEWVLEPSALLEGVKSTTRYRKPTGPKNRNRSDPPAPIRQYSGRLGGQANRQQSQKRKFQDRLDRDMVLGQGGRSGRFETTGRFETAGRFGLDRVGARSYSPATPRMTGLDPIRDLSQCPPIPTPKTEFECLSTVPSPYYYPAPSSKDIGSGINDGLFSMDGDYEGLDATPSVDGLPTPSDYVASLGEVTGVCVDDESPVFADDEAVDVTSTGPSHCTRMWDSWQYFEGGES